MILTFNLSAFSYTCYFLAYFFIAYIVISASRLEELFKQGKVWQIRIAQLMLAFVVGFILASGTKALIDAFIV